MALTTLPTMAGNDSTAFFVSFLSASANLFNHFFNAPSSFGGEAGPPPPPPPPPPKLPMAESTIVVIPVTKEVSVKITSAIYSRIKVRILSDKGVFLSRTFSRLF